MRVKRIWIPFFDTAIRIGARVFAFLNIVIIIIGLLYFVPASWSKEEWFGEILKSKSLNEAIYFILPINDNADNFIYVLVSFVLVSSILLFVLRWKGQVRTNIWILLLINIYSMSHGVRSVVRSQEYRNRLIKSLESGGIDVGLIESFVLFDFGTMSFLICFVFLFFNSVFLWRMSGKGVECETN
ncbi:MAG: hypothetical protein LBD67_08470 [Candidatus Accumulibacter sp.]|jgi:hypothetical protein|nr:hypothetical protein [Accumulibacter sp.]